MGFTGRGMAMHGVAKIALFGLLLSLKSDLINGSY